MSDRASGVRNLRAMFESSQSPASPEPRGRAPADNASTADGPVRPTSKVRASFVSVEPGHLIPKDPAITTAVPDAATPVNANRRLSFSGSQDEKEDVTAELKKVASEQKEAPEVPETVPETIPETLSDVVPEQAVETRESSRAPPPIHEVPNTTLDVDDITKGVESLDLAPDEPTPAVEDIEAPATVEPVVEQEQEAEVQEEELEAHDQGDQEAAPSPPVDVPSDNLDTTTAEVQEEASPKPADPIDDAAVSGGEALSPPTEEPTKEPTEEPREALPAESAKTTVEPPVAENPVTVATEPVAATTKAPATSLKSKSNGTPAASSKISTKKPPTISTTKAPTTIASSSKSPLPKSPGFAKLPKTPTTPKIVPSVEKSPVPAAKSPAPGEEQPKPATSRPVAPKTVAPKHVAPKTTTTPKAVAPKTTTALKEPTKAPAAKPSRTSLRPSAATTTVTKTRTPVAETKKPVAPKPTASKPATSSPTTKESTTTTTTSPGGFKKPRPKSPTRPVRLPSHLTAPTAASAAKHGDEPATQKLGRKPSTTSRPPKTTLPPARKVASRASLAPNTTAPGKRPESRASTKGATDEGFLARMMRPTTASASKTLEKPASPPRRGGSVRVAPKSKAHESTITKGKKKVAEAVTKAKDAVTNGHDSEHHDEETHASEAHADESHIDEAQGTELAPSDETAADIPAREATPEQQAAESSAIEIQTPNFESQAIR